MHFLFTYYELNARIDVGDWRHDVSSRHSDKIKVYLCRISCVSLFFNSIKNESQHTYTLDGLFYWAKESTFFAKSFIEKRGYYFVVRRQSCPV